MRVEDVCSHRTVPRAVWISFAFCYLLAMAAFIPIMCVAMRAQRLVKQE